MARLMNSALGMQLGRLYAERYVAPETRASAAEMIAYLRKAFAERLAGATWMDDATKAEAQAKLARFKFKVGYPSIWPVFSEARHPTGRCSRAICAASERLPGHMNCAASILA